MRNPVSVIQEKLMSKEDFTKLCFSVAISGIPIAIIFIVTMAVTLFIPEEFGNRNIVAIQWIGALWFLCVGCAWGILISIFWQQLKELPPETSHKPKQTS